MGGLVLLYVGMFFVPNYKLSPHVFSMFPCFVIGFLFNRYRLFELFFDRPLVLLTLFFGIIYVVLFLFFKKETYKYWSLYSVWGEGWHQLFVDIQRSVTGISGSFFVIGLIRLSYTHFHPLISKALSYLGKNTLQLYVISMLPFFISWETCFSDGTVYYGLALVSAVVVTSVSVVLVELLKKNKITNYLFFGQSMKGVKKS